eukprot:jgi/Picsp_1/6009/NSC_03363-R1_guanine nucleotide-binding protein
MLMSNAERSWRTFVKDKRAGSGGFTSNSIYLVVSERRRIMQDSRAYQLGERTSWAIQSQKEPDLFCDIRSEFRKCKGENDASVIDNVYLKGVKWCPDGTCFLSASSDELLRVFDLDSRLDQLGRGELPGKLSNKEIGYGGNATNELDNHVHLNESDVNLVEEADCNSAVQIPVGELVYDFAWFPGATKIDSTSFCFGTVCRGHPTHIYDACGGALRCSYVAYNEMDEIASIYSLAFHHSGQFLYLGGKSSIYTFDVSRPGRDHFTYGSFERKKVGQPGILSCLAPSIQPNSVLSEVIATGSYSGIAALHDVYNEEMICLLEGHVGGVTHVQFSADGNYLYTGARKDEALYCWDVRYLSGAVYTIKRKSTRTNQRIYFDIEPSGRHLISGGDDGLARVFDLRDGEQAGSFRAAESCVNGAAFHPVEPFVATCSGERLFQDFESKSNLVGDNSIKIWKFAMVSLA